MGAESLVAEIPELTRSNSVLVLSVMRLVWVVHFNFYSLSTYNIGIVYSVSECALAVIASCGPALRPLFVRWFPGCFGSLAETEDRYGPRAYDRYPSHSHSYAKRISMPSSNQQRTKDYPEFPNQYPLQHVQRSHQTEVETGTPNGSDDAIVPQTGIMMTREYEVNCETASVISTAR